MKYFIIFIIAHISVLNSAQSLDHLIDSEELSYTIYFKTGFIWVAIGEMNMNTSIDEDLTTIRLTAKTFKKWRSLQEVEFDIKAVYNNVTGFSESYLRRSIENEFYIKDSIEFDQTNLNAIEVIEETGKEPMEYSIQLKDNVVDILSSLNLLRSQINNAELDTQFKSNLFYSRYEYDFAYTVEKIAVQKIRKIGKLDCVVLNTKTIGGRFFNDKSKLQIWMSTDKRSIPYMFETPFKFGKIRAVINQK